MLFGAAGAKQAEEKRRAREAWENSGNRDTTLTKMSKDRRHRVSRPASRFSSTTTTTTTIETIDDIITIDDVVESATEADAMATIAPTATAHQIEHSPDLSEEQQQIINTALEGRSFFFTGAAGTGKSHLLRHLVSSLVDIHGDESVFVTAPTGVAACNVSGSTIYSFAGIGLGTGAFYQIVSRVRRSKDAMRRWNDAKVLIIDEISMLPGDIFELIERCARAVRFNESPFGGIQIILCGDFYQLPPVSKAEQRVPFCFETPTWNKVVSATYVLQKVWRQKDSSFVELLSELREGRLSEEHRKMLDARVGVQLNTSVPPARLFPHRDSATQLNAAKLRELPPPIVVYEAEDTGDPDTPQYKAMVSGCPAASTLTLKLNAQVILLKNLDLGLGLVNGSRGIVTGWDKTIDLGITLPIVSFDNGVRMAMRRARFSTYRGKHEICARVAIPLALAWALSIHKAQGSTVSALEIDPERIWEDGQAYVALSRVTSLEGLRLLAPVNPTSVKVNPVVAKYYKTITRAAAANVAAAQRRAAEDEEVKRELLL